MAKKISALFLLGLAWFAPWIGRAEPARLTRTALLETLTREVTNHYNTEGEIQLELPKSWVAPVSVAETWHVEVIEFPPTLSSSLMLRCRLEGEAPVGEFMFLLRASSWGDAWAVKQPLVPGAPFEISQLEIRRVDFLRERDAVPTTANGTGYNFSRSVNLGRLLTWHDLARRPLVRKGDSVEVSANEGALVITMKALCLESGAQGDTVTVRNPESHKDFSARVIDQNHVQVQF